MIIGQQLRGQLVDLVNYSRNLIQRRRDSRVIKARYPGTASGWLIFDAPEADLGVHPTEDGEVAPGTADISFYCDDIAHTVSELRSRGVEFTQEVEDRGYGLVSFFKDPGDFRVRLYQPKYHK